MSRLRATLTATLCLLLCLCGQAQQPSVTTPVVRLKGLRSVGAHGAFKAAAYLPDGDLLLLYDQGDGLRLLKTDAAATSVLAQTQLGAAGDSGIALSLDPNGNVFVAGTSSSGKLSGTVGTPYPAAADTSLNSFVARFDANLNLSFLTFLGAGRTEVTGLDVTGDAVFVTGATYSATLPTTAGAFQHTPPNANLGSGNAFVQRFSHDGASLTFSTYLNGVDGGSVPAAVAAAADDSVYVAGETSSSTFPTAAALQPQMTGAVSGFLTKLAADGGSVQFSTFLAGTGIASLGLAPDTGNLLLAGNLSLGDFPMPRVTNPVVNTFYQSLVRLSSDGQTLLDATVLLPSTQTSVLPGPNGTAWVTGSLTAALTPQTANRGSGDSFVLHLNSSDQMDQVLRLGGLVLNNPAYARLSSSLGTPALSADGQTLTLPGSLSAQTDPSLRSTQAFDLGLNASGSSVLTATPQDLLPTTCSPGADCSGSGGLLTQLTLGSTEGALTLSTGDPPGLTLRNESPVAISGVAVTASGSSPTTDCTDSLAPFAQCALLLSAANAETVAVSASNAASVTTAVPATSAAAPPLALDVHEVDFGVVTLAGSPASHSITVTNLSGVQQSFSSTADNQPSAPPYTLSELSSTCAGTPAAHTLAPLASCTVQLGLSASALPQNDGLISTNWRLGTRDVAISGYTQAASLTVSTAAINFGPQPTSTGAARLPRYLYLSNNSASVISHSAVSLPPDSPFAVLDGCPALLGPSSVCQLVLTYNQTAGPSFDSLTLSLDQGLAVLLTGETLSTLPVAVVSSPSPLLASPSSVTFTAPVTVTQVSSEAAALQVTNTSSTAVPLTASVLGDFTLQNGCPSSLAPQQACSLTLTFAPSEPGIREGTLTLSSTAGSETILVPLTGTATPLLLTGNGAIALGTTVVGESLTAWYKIQGSYPAITADVSGAGFSLALLADDGNGHGALAPAAYTMAVTAPCEGCWLALRFLPQSAGAATGTVRISSAAGGHAFTGDLQATALPAQGLVLTPPALNFGAVALGSSSIALTTVLTNLLPADAVTTVGQVSTTGDFALAFTNTPFTCAFTLQPMASCSLQVVFTPTSSGERTGTLTIASSAGTLTQTLSGVGVSTGLASTSAPVSTTLVLFPTSTDFGPQPVHAVGPARLFTVQNTSAQTQTLSFASARNFPLVLPAACVTLPPSATCTFAITFTPEQAGELTGTLLLNAAPQDGSPPTQTVLSTRGYGVGTVGLTLSAGTSPEDPLSFGNVPSGSSGMQTLTLTNADIVPHAVRRLTTTAPFQGATTCAATLPLSGTCTVSLAYTAQNAVTGSGGTPRADTGTLTVEDDTGNAVTSVYLAATALPSSAGTSLQPGALPTFTFSQTALTFPNTHAGAVSAPQILTIANNGALPVAFGAVGSNSGEFLTNTTCTVLQPGSTCTITVTYQPSQNETKATHAVLLVPSNAATMLDFVSLLGSSFTSAFQLAPGSLDFGTVALGSSSQLNATLTNTTDLPATALPLQSSGDFTVDASACPTPGSPLAAGQSCSLVLTFTPSAPGVRSGTLLVADPSTSTPPSIQLQGTGLAGRLQVAPAALDFGSVRLSTSSSLEVVLTNSGALALTGLTPSLGGANSTEFHTTTDCGTTLAVGASCTATVIFSPSGLGTRAATLSITSTDPSSPALIPLTGEGMQPPDFTFTANGGASASAAVRSGQTASFALNLTPQGGFAGAVALTCTALAAAPNASCTLADNKVLLAGSPVSTSASIATLSGLSSSLVWPLGLLPLLPFASRRRCRTQKRTKMRSAAGAFAFAGLASLGGCGHGPSVAGNPYTPAGTYQYQVTAASVGATFIVHTVSLTVTVQ